ncbi:putative RAD1 protein [Sordaria sp. MPI-SDFR-AT-0083]|nr:putative RAD1 protein [Sordaria sp. MPI-SDFR-AT-0083]
MDSPLLEVWHGASASPFLPTIGKGTQFPVAFLLLLIGFTLTGAFTLNRSIINLPLLGIPASLAFANMSQPTQDASGPPLFRAVTSSTRPLYQLLKAIGFTNKIHVEITPEGLRFGADHARVMQGAAHWNKNLFASYITNLPPAPANNDDDDAATDDPEPVSFQISLPAFLETLQIFGVADVAARQSRLDIDPLARGNPRLNNQHRTGGGGGHGSDAFSLQTLHGSSTTSSNGTCILSYPSDGGPFSIILDEAGVKTTCNLTTYLPETPEDIPFDVEDLSFKVIMQARYLLDALAEVGSISPERLTIAVSRKEPYLRFRTSGSHSGTGAPGVESTVDFKRGRDLLETFSVRAVDRAKGERRWSQTFKFDTIKAATEAMKIASKVSLRGDGQGVLSMQFMVEVEGAGGGGGGAGGGVPGGGVGLSFLDFRFVPYATDGDEESDTEGEGDDVDMGDV